MALKREVYAEFSLGKVHCPALPKSHILGIRPLLALPDARFVLTLISFFGGLVSCTLPCEGRAPPTPDIFLIYDPTK